MSGASYRRGSALISRQICAEFGCRGCVNCTEIAPTPRPPDWGNATRERAHDTARAILRGARAYGLPDPALDVLAMAVQERARVGKATAMDAARRALDL